MKEIKKDARLYSRNSHTEIAPLLLTHGADINAKDNDGFTSLMLASEKGHNKTVTLLLYHGTDINAKNKDGATSLLFARKKSY